MEGILPLWKPKGLTSHDCVFKVRRLLQMKKVGHTGTLDPDVTGVLPICLGRATKIAEYITNAGKTYEGEVTLGLSTTTEDASGEIVQTKPVDREISREEIEETLSSFIGEITQTPPMYSAVKVKGKRLYEYAREGIEVERPSRKVHIYELDLLNEPILHEEKLSFRFVVSCSKGTYIRTLAVMIGEKLGYPAYMSHLVRTASASFTKDDCVTFEQLQQHVKQGTASKLILPLELGINHLPTYEINDKLAKKVRNGAVLPLLDDWPDEEVVFIFQQKALAIYDTHPEKKDRIKPVKVLRNN